MMRMKEKALAHQKISTTKIRERYTSTQYNIGICIYYIAYIYIGVMDCIGIDIEMVGL